jgi:hypothetical protein
MLTGVNIYEQRKYISKDDSDKNNPTIFHIGLLDHNLVDYIDEQTTTFEISSKNPKDSAKANININRRNRLAVKFGLKGLENFLDPQTKQPVKFDTISVSVNGKNYPAVSDQLMSMFTKALLSELAEVIWNENHLSEEERKN